MKKIVLTSPAPLPQRAKEAKMLIKNKKWVFPYILGSILVLLFAGLAHAQTTTGQENWVYTYNNPTYDRNDFANDIVVNPYDGNIYLAGRTYRTSSYYYFSVISLNPGTGDTNWTYRYNGPGNAYNEAYSIVVGADKHIYAAGYTYGSGTWYKELTVVKLDTLGNEKHVYKYNKCSNQDDEAFDIFYGPDRHIYIAGYGEGTDGKADFTVIKLDTALVQKRVYERLSTWTNQALSVVVDSDLNVWAAGHTKGPVNLDFTVVKLDTHLTQQGIYLYGEASSNDYAVDLCLPWSGTGVYAAGRTNSGANFNFAIVSLDASCNENWRYIYDGPTGGYDEAYSIVCGPDNAVYAAGYSGGSGTGRDYTVIMMKPGDSWIYRYNGTGNSSDEALSIDISPSGDYVYAAGYSYETGNNYDIVVTKHSLSSDTSAHWVYTYNGNNGNDRGRAIATGSDGNTYVGGHIRPTGSYYKMAAISLPQNFPPTIPSLVSPTNAEFLNDTTVSWFWHPSTDFETSISGYYLARSMNPAFAIYDSVWAAGTTYTGPLTDTTWYWAVKAQDSQGNQSDWSGIWSFSFDLTPPDNPLLLSPIEDIIVTDTSVAFEWGSVTFGTREVPSPVSYVLQVDTTVSFSSPIMTDSNTATATTLEFAAIDAYYYWRVKAYDVAGNQGSYSNPETFRIDITPPAIDSETVWEETFFCGPFDCFAKVTDMWGIDGVLLYYKRMEDPAWFSTPMSQGSGDWYLAQIPAGTIDQDTIKYYYYAIDNAEYETRVPETDYYWFIANSTGIVEDNPEIPNIFAFNVKGNLIKGKATFNLSLPRSASITLEIYDASGRRIATPATGMRSAGNHTVTWTPSANGIYFYSLKSQWKRETGKILYVR